MAGYDQNAYEQVNERIARFYRTHENGRITTDLVDMTGDPGSTRWIVKAYVYRDADTELPAGTGLAFDTDGVGMAQKTAALETAETSAVGRALAQAGFSGSKRVTREEMGKTLIPDLLRRVAEATSKDDTRDVWQDANKHGVLDAVKQRIYDRNEELTKAGESGE